MDESLEINKLRRRIQTLESRMQDLIERVSAYESGTKENPNTVVYIKDPKTAQVAGLDYDSSSDAVRVTKVRK